MTYRYRNTLLALCALMLCVVSTAQQVVSTTHSLIHDQNRKAYVLAVNTQDDQPFVGLVLKFEEPVDAELICRYVSQSGAEQSASLSWDTHVDAVQTNMIFLPASVRQIRIEAGDGRNLPATYNSYFIHPGKSSTTTPSIMHPRREDPCEKPTVLMRTEWCPDGSCHEDATPEFTDATHAIVHHTAGTNVSSDWSAVVRAIWLLHVDVNGWDDIGYNWLVDPNGVFYEGRGHGRQGAHFCSQNGKTTGICVIGNFQTQPPTSEAITGVQRLLSWICFENDMDPLGYLFHPSSGLDLLQISGHRDGCATACPGEQFYPMFDNVRFAVDSLLGLCDPTSTTPIVKEVLLHHWPNPAHDVLRLKYAKDHFAYQVYDAGGRRVQQGTSRNSDFQINISRLTGGLYYLVVEDDIVPFLKS